jgi:hypothetical protein
MLLARVGGRRLCVVHTSTRCARARQRMPARGLRADHRPARRRGPHLRVAQLEVPRERRAVRARRGGRAGARRRRRCRRHAAHHVARARSGRAAPAADGQPAARHRARLRRPGVPRRRPAAASGREPRRADLGGGRLRRAASRVRVGALDRLPHRLPGDDRPLRRRRSCAPDRAGDRRCRRDRARPAESSRCPIRSEVLPADPRGRRSAPRWRRSSSSGPRRWCAVRWQAVPTSTSCGRGSPTWCATTCCRTATARSTRRRRSSCSNASGGTGPTRCSRISSRRSCTAPARTRCRTRLFHRGLAQLDLAELAEAAADPDPAWVDDGRLLTALLGPDRTDAALATGRAILDGAGVDGVLDTVSLAVSERMLRYDTDGERDFHDDFGWLDITHGLTYANAARWHRRPVAGDARHRPARDVDRVPRQLDRSARVAHRVSPSAPTSNPDRPTSSTTGGRSSTRRCSTARRRSSCTPTP